MVAIRLIARCVHLESNVSLQTITYCLIAAGTGLFLLLGLWTLIAGVTLAIVELSMAFSHAYDPWLSVLLATLGVALALLGSGAWSVDARRSGWKRIEIRRPEN
jgi:hypothetical protein